MPLQLDYWLQMPNELGYDLRYNTGYLGVYPSSGEYLLILLSVDLYETEKQILATYTLDGKLIDYKVSRYVKLYDGYDQTAENLEFLQGELSTSLEFTQTSFITDEKGYRPADILDNLDIRLLGYLEHKVYQLTTEGKFVLKSEKKTYKKAYTAKRLTSSNTHKLSDMLDE